MSNIWTNEWSNRMHCAEYWVCIPSAVLTWFDSEGVLFCCVVIELPPRVPAVTTHESWSSHGLQHNYERDVSNQVHKTMLIMWLISVALYLL